MGDFYKKGIDLFEGEYEKIVSKGNLTSSDLELAGKLLDAIKDSYKICKLKDDDYESEYSGRRGYSMSRSRHYPSMGEYYVEGSYAPYGYGQSNNGSYMRGYSGEGNYGRGSSNSSGFKAKLHQLMNEATNDRERNMVQSWIEEMGNL